MSNAYSQQVSMQYGVPREVMDAVVWAEEHTMFTTIDAAGARLANLYKDTGSWDSALYNYHYQHHKNQDEATQFAQTVLEVAGYKKGDIPADEPESWMSKAKRILLWDEEAAEEIRRGQGAVGYGDTMLGKIMANGGFIILGIVIIAIAIITIPQVKGAVATVATKGVK